MIINKGQFPIFTQVKNQGTTRPYIILTPNAAIYKGFACKNLF